MQKNKLKNISLIILSSLGLFVNHSALDNTTLEDIDNMELRRYDIKYRFNETDKNNVITNFVLSKFLRKIEFNKYPEIHKNAINELTELQKMVDTPLESAINITELNELESKFIKEFANFLENYTKTFYNMATAEDGNAELKDLLEESKIIEESKTEKVIHDLSNIDSNTDMLTALAGHYQSTPELILLHKFKSLLICNQTDTANMLPDIERLLMINIKYYFNFLKNQVLNFDEINDALYHKVVKTVLNARNALILLDAINADKTRFVNYIDNLYSSSNLYTDEVIKNLPHIATKTVMGAYKKCSFLKVMQNMDYQTVSLYKQRKLPLDDTSKDFLNYLSNKVFSNSQGIFNSLSNRLKDEFLTDSDFNKFLNSQSDKFTSLHRYVQEKINQQSITETKINADGSASPIAEANISSPERDASRIAPSTPSKPAKRARY